ncbi:hypothetical protein RFI_06062 [Reticulomyxa filosa]|uniref:Uncharacterized protein n=1 Tax=Reticulomyxa filosa TaxID=46433 RepID=X6NYZ3_RETFI|nr:hypothetical protein RFI_06062 [Reticulomyxa filosa]|eukprot:ETO31059.1 hypothetical protein RFI_06062 [Reticulomyxa filosa]
MKLLQCDNLTLFYQMIYEIKRNVLSSHPSQDHVDVVAPFRTPNQFVKPTQLDISSSTSDQTVVQSEEDALSSLTHFRRDQLQELFQDTMSTKPTPTIDESISPLVLTDVLQQVNFSCLLAPFSSSLPSQQTPSLSQQISSLPQQTPSQLQSQSSQPLPTGEDLRCLLSVLGDIPELNQSNDNNNGNATQEKKANKKPKLPNFNDLRADEDIDRGKNWTNVVNLNMF